MNRQQLLEAVKSRDLQSEKVKECAESVKESQDVDKSTAFAICQAQENKGNLSALSFDTELAEDDPCWDGYEAVGMKPDPNGSGQVPNCVPEDQVENAATELAEGCPEGEVEINGECVSVEDAGTPPGLLNSEPRSMHLTLENFDVGPIEREELSDTEVRYTNLKLISPGMWTDSGSQETVWYSPDGIRNLEITDNARVNIMHDLDANGEPNEPSDVGRIDPGSKTVDDEGNLYANVTLETDTPGGEYADENLQSALESGGQVGIGGPSVEIPERGQKVEMNETKGVPELKAGKIDGAGLVWNPAAKSVDFSRETASRAVAMASDEQNTMYLEEGQSGMQDIEAIRATLSENGIDVEAKDDDEVKELAEAILELADDEEEEEPPEEETPEEEEPEEEEETEMAGEDMAAIQEQIDDLWGKIDELEEAMMGEEMQNQTEELESELAETREELSEANETVAELEEAKEDLEKRLSSLEDEPNKKEMMDADSDEDWYDADDGVAYDSATGSTHF